MNFKKRVNGSWTNTPHYIHNTSTDTITALPADIYANDTTATVGLKGNMEQPSQPSPTTPIQPSECGERTGNLLDESDVVYDGTKDVAYMKTKPYRLVANETITVSINYNASAIWVINAANDVALALVQNNNTLTYSRTSTLNIYVKLRFDNGIPQNLKVMLNLGSTALPYEPYGYFIEIEVS